MSIDYIVSKIQATRGLQKDLPQPLRHGEFGWAMDTQRLFIGADPALMAPGIQILGSDYDLVQNWLSGTKQVTVGPSFVYEDFVNSVSTGEYDSSNVLIKDPVRVCYGYDAVNGVLYFIPDPALVGIDPLADPSYVDLEVFDRTFSTTAVAPPAFSLVIDENGALSIPGAGGHHIAAALASMLNQISSSTIYATTKLNVEVITEYSKKFETTFQTAELPPTASWTTIPTIQMLGVDTALITYSLSASDGTDWFTEVGVMQIASTDFNATLSTNSTRDSTIGSGDIEFRAQLLGGLVVVQYQSSLPSNAWFKFTELKWSAD